LKCERVDLLNRLEATVSGIVYELRRSRFSVLSFNSEAL